MNKIIIGRKEIEGLKSTIGKLKKYKEEEYKEVFISVNEVLYVYDIYCKVWDFISTRNIRHYTIKTYKEGFYNYNIIEKVIPVYKGLDKSKIYVNKPTYLKYNKELEVWEEIFIKDNKAISKIISFDPFYLKFHETITKEEFNKLILTCELLT